MVGVNDNGEVMVLTEFDAQLWREAGFGDSQVPECPGIYLVFGHPTHYFCVDCKDVHRMCSVQDRWKHKLDVVFPKPCLQRELVDAEFGKSLSAMSKAVYQPATYLLSFLPLELYQGMATAG